MTIEPHVTVPFLSLARPATPVVVGEIRRDVRAFAERHGAGPDALAAIELAVSEAVANAVVHGSIDGADTVLVEADVEEGELEIVVVDAGPGFTPGPVPGLGLGLGLMRDGALAFEIRDRPSGGVEIWMRFPLGE